MDVAIVKNASVANKGYWCFDVLPWGYLLECSETSLQLVSYFTVELANSMNVWSPNLKLVKWNVVAAGVLFHRLACELHQIHVTACVHYHVALKSQTVSRTSSMAHLSIQVRCNECRLKTNARIQSLRSWQWHRDQLNNYYIYQGCSRLTVRSQCVFFYLKSYVPVRCNFKKSEILRCGSVRFSDIVNPTVRFGAVSQIRNPTVQFGAVPRWTFFSTVGIHSPWEKPYNTAISPLCTVWINRGFVRFSPFFSGHERNRCFSMGTVWIHRTNPRIRTVFLSGTDFILSAQSQQQQQ